MIGTSWKRNIFLFLFLTVVTNFFFISSNWIYFWTKYMTFGQLGWVDAIGFAVALLLDIPTGAIADLLGRKKTIFLATFLSAIGAYFIASSNSMIQIFLGWIVTSAGITFYSGAGEALAYDTLVEYKKENEYQHIISISQSLALFTLATVTFIGGFLYVYNFRLPHYLWFGGYCLGVIASLFLYEPKVDTYTFSFSNYLKQLVLGLKELLKPTLRSFFPFFFVLLGVEFLYSWGFVRPAMATSFGFYAKEQSVILAVLALFSAAIIRFVPYFRKRISDIKGLLILTGLSVVSFFAASFPIGQYGIFVMIILAIVGKLGYPWISIVVNHHIQSEYRATTLSSVSFITKIPYVLLAVIAGDAIQSGHLGLFTAGIAVFIFIGIAISLGIYFFGRREQLVVEIA